MIAEGGASVSVDFKLVLAPGVLGGEEAHYSSHSQTGHVPEPSPAQAPPHPTPMSEFGGPGLCAALWGRAVNGWWRL